MSIFKCFRLYVCVAYVCMCTTYGSGAQRLEEGIGSLGIGVIGSC